MRGLTGNNEVLLVKSTLDFVTCLVRLRAWESAWPLPLCRP